MKLVETQDVNAYEPPAHFGVSCVKIQGEETGLTKFWQGLSTFEADGGADWQYGAGTFGAETEKTYFVVEGEITVENEAGEQFVAGPQASISMLPNEKRKMWVSGGSKAVVLVTITAPNA
ncbi:cupin [Reinekea marinisedimentorum]|uniref:(S)-ureidoglycine aminohydrolase cupin domain-containing protein n=1 Tax=Reinekea marinisedimentorum TaxID=230495 RepID=A0A4R3I7D8_9GAMM|nr:cupin [Reinekea marinisedimentorum]TCS41087.1 hypothetical protein BCF53_107101 [Reinekea marinisedimentorum]